MDVVQFRVLERCVRIECDDSDVLRLILAVFDGFDAVETRTRCDVHYRVVAKADGGLRITCGGVAGPAVSNPESAVLAVERDLTVALQQQRPDLLFLHAASVQKQGRALLLIGESGSGKSTTTWGLLDRGFRYLSDELSPIDVEALQVHPYPRALVLKARPPPGFALPGGALMLAGTFHVPVCHLRHGFVQAPCPVGAAVMVEHRPKLEAPVLRAIGPAEATARIYGSVLNALHFPACGLDAVARIAETVPCFRLLTADLRATVDCMAGLLGPLDIAA
jgi:hypothetical protein